MIFPHIFSDDSLGYEYPFVLKVVQFGGSWCAWCPWHRFCRGCELPCTNDEFSFAASYIAIDWDPTALHLRYLAVQEKAFIEDPSVEASLKVRLNLLHNYLYRVFHMDRVVFKELLYYSFIHLVKNMKVKLSKKLYQ